MEIKLNEHEIKLIIKNYLEKHGIKITNNDLNLWKIHKEVKANDTIITNYYMLMKKHI